MKLVLLLFCVGLLSPIFSQTAKTMGDPIPGLDVKLGINSPGGIIASGVTDKNGVVEFKNLADGTGYFLKIVIGLKEKGNKSINRDHTVVIGFACTSGPNKILTPQVKTEKWDEYEVTYTVLGNSIKATIVVSRSNIK